MTLLSSHEAKKVYFTRGFATHLIHIFVSLHELNVTVIP